ncbi:MAG: hypothetical protein R3258_00055 [Acidimicrobiia bacterium]|nr:hypothetical protein [Acidimicrobiia bacterium]
MPNDLVTQTRFVHGLFLGNQVAAGSIRALRKEAAEARSQSNAHATAHPIRDAFGHGLISLGEKLVGHSHPEPQFEQAA